MIIQILNANLQCFLMKKTMKLLNVKDILKNYKLNYNLWELFLNLKINKLDINFLIVFL